MHRRWDGRYENLSDSKSTSVHATQYCLPTCVCVGGGGGGGSYYSNVHNNPMKKPVVLLKYNSNRKITCNHRAMLRVILQLTSILRVIGIYY